MSHRVFTDGVIVEMAQARFKDFIRQLKEQTGSRFDENALPIVKTVFINGYIGAHVDIANNFCDTNTCGIPLINLN